MAAIRHGLKNLHAESNSNILKKISSPFSKEDIHSRSYGNLFAKSVHSQPNYPYKTVASKVFQPYNQHFCTVKLLNSNKDGSFSPNSKALSKSDFHNFAYFNKRQKHQKTAIHTELVEETSPAELSNAKNRTEMPPGKPSHKQSSGTKPQPNIQGVHQIEPLKVTQFTKMIEQFINSVRKSSKETLNTETYLPGSKTIQGKEKSLKYRVRNSQERLNRSRNKNDVQTNKNSSRKVSKRTGKHHRNRSLIRNKTKYSYNQTLIHMDEKRLMEFLRFLKHNKLNVKGTLHKKELCSNTTNYQQIRRFSTPGINRIQKPDKQKLIGDCMTTEMSKDRVQLAQNNITPRFGGLGFGGRGLHKESAKTSNNTSGSNHPYTNLYSSQETTKNYLSNPQNEKNEIIPTLNVSMAKNNKLSFVDTKEANNATLHTTMKSENDKKVIHVKINNVNKTDNIGLKICVQSYALEKNLLSPPLRSHISRGVKHVPKRTNLHAYEEATDIRPIITGHIEENDPVAPHDDIDSIQFKNTETGKDLSRAIRSSSFNQMQIELAKFIDRNINNGLDIELQEPCAKKPKVAENSIVTQDALQAEFKEFKEDVLYNFSKLKSLKHKFSSDLEFNQSDLNTFADEIHLDGNKHTSNSSTNLTALNNTVSTNLEAIKPAEKKFLRNAYKKSVKICSETIYGDKKDESVKSYITRLSRVNTSADETRQVSKDTENSMTDLTSLHHKLSSNLEAKETVEKKFLRNPFDQSGKICSKTIYGDIRKESIANCNCCETARIVKDSENRMSNLNSLNNMLPTNLEAKETVEKKFLRNSFDQSGKICTKSIYRDIKNKSIANCCETAKIVKDIENSISNITSLNNTLSTNLKAAEKKFLRNSFDQICSNTIHGDMQNDFKTQTLLDCQTTNNTVAQLIGTSSNGVLKHNQLHSTNETYSGQSGSNTNDGVETFNKEENKTSDQFPDTLFRAFKYENKEVLNWKNKLNKLHLEEANTTYHDVNAVLITKDKLNVIDQATNPFKNNICKDFFFKYSQSTPNQVIATLSKLYPELIRKSRENINREEKEAVQFRDNVTPRTDSTSVTCVQPKKRIELHNNNSRSKVNDNPLVSINNEKVKETFEVKTQNNKNKIYLSHYDSNQRLLAAEKEIKISSNDIIEEIKDSELISIYNKFKKKQKTLQRATRKKVEKIHKNPKSQNTESIYSVLYTVDSMKSKWRANKTKAGNKSLGNKTDSVDGNPNMIQTYSVNYTDDENTMADHNPGQSPIRQTKSALSGFVSQPRVFVSGKIQNTNIVPEYKYKCKSPWAKSTLIDNLKHVKPKRNAGEMQENVKQLFTTSLYNHHQLNHKLLKNVIKPNNKRADVVISENTSKDNIAQAKTIVDELIKKNVTEIGPIELMLIDAQTNSLAHKIPRMDDKVKPRTFEKPTHVKESKKENKVKHCKQVFELRKFTSNIEPSKTEHQLDIITKKVDFPKQRLVKFKGLASRSYSEDWHKNRKHQLDNRPKKRFPKNWVLKKRALLKMMQHAENTLKNNLHDDADLSEYKLRKNDSQKIQTLKKKNFNGDSQNNTLLQSNLKYSHKADDRTKEPNVTKYVNNVPCNINPMHYNLELCKQNRLHKVPFNTGQKKFYSQAYQKNKIENTDLQNMIKQQSKETWDYNNNRNNQNEAFKIPPSNISLQNVTSMRDVLPNKNDIELDEADCDNVLYKRFYKCLESERNALFEKKLILFKDILHVDNSINVVRLYPEKQKSIHQLHDDSDATTDNQ